ncbi:rRNA methyltransferase 1, mitochondrial-like [Pollicipes pollicipes]|uniref:rRNA methyltransferase 1, mitochondrial-like n=1 Tax=Pollicipes pollicipes TaxID=41117 RepID=UPI0018857C58|nr:rRNA methyltransferase 1, mitochondrial-like [Pollicipes pollicipes]
MQDDSSHKATSKAGKPRGSHVRPSDKPRGKKLRKKDKLGFIESELVDGDEDQVQVLYGLHPVQLALAAGRRTVHRVYHRQEATGGRLSRLLAECAARGVGTVPLPVTQLDTIARGTGVHQGVCARVGPLRPRPVSELLTELGYPPVATDPDKLEAGVADLPTVGDPVPASGERTAHRRRLWLLLDRVQDPMNFGSILRSSYFLGVDAILIPDKNSCPLSPTVSKASAGVLEVFPTHSDTKYKKKKNTKRPCAHENTALEVKKNPYAV